MARSLNEIYSALDNKLKTKFVKCIQEECSGDASFYADINKFTEYSKESLAKLFKECKGNIIWDDNNFVPKPMWVSKFNLKELRDKLSGRLIEKISFSYPTKMLSTCVKIQLHFTENKESSLLLNLNDTTVQDSLLKDCSSLSSKLKGQTTFIPYFS